MTASNRESSRRAVTSSLDPENGSPCEPAPGITPGPEEFRLRVPALSQKDFEILASRENPEKKEITDSAIDALFRRLREDEERPVFRRWEEFERERREVVREWVRTVLR